MLPKKNRVDKKLIEKIFKQGIFLKSSDTSFRYLKIKSDVNFKISVVVPKAVFRSAVKRNSLRRKGYAIIEKYTPLIPIAVVGVFIIGKRSVENLENEVKNILNKIY